MAHNSVFCYQAIVPIAGLPGCGYESLGGQLPSKYNFEKRDSMGSRENPLYENTWHYDASYVWRKAWQASEDGKLKVWSFGGDNVTDLFWLLWPGLIVLTPVAAGEWKRRANAFRKSVNLPPLTEWDISRYVATAARFAKTLQQLCTLRRDVLVLDSSKPVAELAEICDGYLSQIKLPRPVDFDPTKVEVDVEYVLDPSKSDGSLAFEDVYPNFAMAKRYAEAKGVNVVAREVKTRPSKGGSL